MTNPLLVHYQNTKGRFDEMLDINGQARPHWRAMLAHLQQEAPELMHERLESVQRQVHDNGVTYNIYADTQGQQRPWSLNDLPMILPAEEWSGIAEAVIQRATLLNQILGDAYGKQTLISEGLLPPALIHGNASFLRPCHGIRQSDGIALHLVAVDLARSPDGRWWVVADRTQAPSGAGYALENRTIISRAFPDLFRDLRVQHLNSFFSSLRDSLAHWGRICAANRGDGADQSPELRSGEAPLIVLLTPGPYNETYFEQSYLARYLGYPLVEGTDLTVRNGLVWLKTLSGPQRVHVILRRVDDDFCDPLELRQESALGIVGLTEAARRGTVLIANGLGSSLMESGALLGYLPKLCQRLLGQSLKMPSVATWWCGEPAACKDVISRLDHLIIKPAFAQQRIAPVFGMDLNTKARQHLIAEIRANPHHYVAQEMVNLSHAPVWQPGDVSSLASAAVGLRVYACATPHGYVVMPGGLTRVASGTDTRVLNMQRGGASKDTWVLAASTVTPAAAAPRRTGVDDLVRGDTHLASRLAENLFWFGRYGERCENSTRLTRTVLDFLLNTAPEQRGGEWQTVQALCIWYGLIKIKGRADETPDEEEDEDELAALAAQSDSAIERSLLKSVVERTVPGLACNLQLLTGIAGNLRERLSLDNWRTLNQLVGKNTTAARLPSLADARTILDGVTSTLMTLSGFALDGMTRDHGWLLMSIGRRAERLQFLCRILRYALKMPANASLDWLLDIADSSVTYRSRYMAQPEWLPVLDLLVLDLSNPRSIAFQLEGLIKYLQRLALHYGPCGDDLLLTLMQELLALKPERDLQCGAQNLLDLLGKLSAAANTLSDRIGMQFFSHSGTLHDETFVP